MILIVLNAPVLLTRIAVQVTASKVSAAMVAATHQKQVLPVIDSKLMIFILRLLNPISLLTGVF